MQMINFTYFSERPCKMGLRDTTWLMEGEQDLAVD